jgi:hypothetical protein
MASRQSTPIDLASEASGTRSVSAVPSGLSLPNAFGRMMAPNGPIQSVINRDKCNRPTPKYNANYNPNTKPPEGLSGGYSPYVYGEPLWDDRPVIVERLPKHFTVAPPPKKARTAWVWNLGYALSNNKKPNQKPPTFWACKHCKLCTILGRNKLIINRPP